MSRSITSVVSTNSCRNVMPREKPFFNSHNVVMTGRKNSFAKIQDLHSVADEKNSAYSLLPSMAPKERGIMCGTF